MEREGGREKRGKGGSCLIRYICQVYLCKSQHVFVKKKNVKVVIAQIIISIVLDHLTSANQGKSMVDNISFIYNVR